MSNIRDEFDAAAAPTIPEGYRLVHHSMTPEMRALLLRADEFTVDEMWIMLLAASPEYKGAQP